MKLTLFILLVFSFNLIQTIGAFAGTMLAMPFAILLLGPEQARLILTAVGILSCIYPVLSCRSFIDWKEVRKIGIYMAAGILAAQFLLKYLYGTAILTVYGLLVIGVALRNFRQTNPRQLPSWLDNLILLMAGLVHGAFLSGGSFLLIYAMEHFAKKDVQRSTLSVLWLVLNGGMVVLFTAQRLYCRENLHYVWVGVIPAILGILLGDCLQKKLDETLFRKFSNCLLFLSGSVLVIKCFL